MHHGILLRTCTIKIVTAYVFCSNKEECGSLKTHILPYYDRIHDSTRLQDNENTYSRIFYAAYRKRECISLIK